MPYMKLIIKTTNFTLTPDIKEYLEKKIQSVDKFLKKKNSDSDSIEARIEIGLPSQHHHSGNIYYVEINISLPGRLIRSTSQKDDIKTAIVDVKKKIQREIKKYYHQPISQRIRNWFKKVNN